MPGWPLPIRLMPVGLMPVGLIPVGLILGLAGLLLLAGCGGGDDFAPPCPVPGILPDAGDLTIYRPTGHDVTDLQLNAQVRGIAGSCKAAGAGHVAATLTVSFRVARGPAATTADVDLGYFVAVVRGETILDRHGYTLHVSFPSNVQSVEVQSDPVDLLLPVSPGSSAAAYRVLAGFQLTPQQLELNRQRATP